MCLINQSIHPPHCLRLINTYTMLAIDVLEIVAKECKFSRVVELSAVNKELRKRLVPVIWRHVGAVIGRREKLYLRSYMNEVCPRGSGMLVAPIWSVLKLKGEPEFEAIEDLFLEVLNGRQVMKALVKHGDRALGKFKALKRIHLILKITFDRRNRLADLEHLQEYFYKRFDPLKIKTILRTDWPELFTTTTLTIDETALIYTNTRQKRDEWAAKGWYNQFLFEGQKALIVQPRAGGVEMKTIRDCPGLVDLSVISKIMSGLSVWIGLGLTRLTLMTNCYRELPIHNRVLLPHLEEIVVNRQAMPIFKEILFMNLSRLVLINKYKDGHYETAQFKDDLSNAGTLIRSAFAIQLPEDDEDKNGIAKLSKVALSDYLFQDAVKILRDAQMTASVLVFDFNDYSYEMSFLEGHTTSRLAEIVTENAALFSLVDHLYFSPELLTMGQFWTNMSASYIAFNLHRLLNTAPLANLTSCHLLEFPSFAEQVAYPFLYPQRWGTPSA
ncbi:hypothetical protein TRVA0_012S00496 [Trichomonascus vanleenenianus]|uniref:uncharacterized protein n=1 Tax=Trichomonascus vanleenenianus TaxID=2268995 RepID=UPI003EC9E275